MSDALKNNLIGLAVAIVLFVFYTTDNKLVKLILGSGVIIVLIVSLIQSQRSVELTDKQKRLSWIVLIPIFYILGYLYKIIK